MSIVFRSLNVLTPKFDKKQIKYLLEKIADDNNYIIKKLQYIFCNDEFLLDLNKQFLQHNYFTDIITFNYSQLPEIQGEIYISVNRIKENSNRYKSVLENELKRVIIHGLLHLCGYDDKTSKEKRLMRQKERFYLQKLGA